MRINLKKLFPIVGVMLIVFFFGISPLLNPIYDLYFFYASRPLSAPPLIEKMLTGDSRLDQHEAVPRHPVVYAVYDDSGKVLVIKQARNHSFLKKLKTTLSLAHEYRLLSIIQDLPQVSSLVGKVHNDAFCVRYIPRTKKTDLSTEEVLQIKTELMHLLDNLHKRGVYHLDLCYQDHIVISETLTPHIIDFGRGIQLSFLMNKILGSYFADKDRLLMLSSIFGMSPGALTSKELNDLKVYYKKKTSRLFSPKRQKDLDLIKKIDGNHF